MATPGKAAAATAKPPPPPSPSPGRAGKPTTLLDVHEVEWIKRELERLLVRDGGVGAAGPDGHAHHHRRKRDKVSPAQRPHAKKGGFLSELLGKHAVSICACGDDAVAGAAAGVSGRRRRDRGGFQEVDKV